MVADILKAAMTAAHISTNLHYFLLNTHQSFLPKIKRRGNSTIEVNTLERYDYGTNQSNRPFLQGLKPLSVGPYKLSAPTVLIIHLTVKRHF
ncbi:hypothetical protein BCT94_05735 [Vibrio breoganii]|nr:hypothetical protein BCT94_05735 [Vibrio breoganii]